MKRTRRRSHTTSPRRQPSKKGAAPGSTVTAELMQIAMDDYRRTGNPIGLWHAMRVLARGHIQFPDEVMEYVGQCAERVCQLRSWSDLPEALGFRVKSGSPSPRDQLAAALNVDNIARLVDTVTGGGRANKPLFAEVASLLGMTVSATGQAYYDQKRKAKRKAE